MALRQLLIGLYAIITISLFVVYGFWYTFLAMFCGVMVPFVLIYLFVPTLNILWTILTILVWGFIILFVPMMSFEGHEDFVMWSFFYIFALPILIYDIIKNILDQLF